MAPAEPDLEQVVSSGPFTVDVTKLNEICEVRRVARSRRAARRCSERNSLHRRRRRCRSHPHSLAPCAASRRVAAQGQRGLGAAGRAPGRCISPACVPQRWREPGGNRWHRPGGPQVGAASSRLPQVQLAPQAAQPGWQFSFQCVLAVQCCCRTQQCAAPQRLPMRHACSVL